MTHKELVIVPREFHSHDTHFFSIFLNALSYHKKCLCDNLFNADETLMKFLLRRVGRDTWNGVVCMALRLGSKESWRKGELIEVDSYLILPAFQNT